jgi:hypothetical protein
MSLSKKLLFLNNKDVQQGGLELVNLKHPKANEITPFLVTCDEESRVVFHEIISYNQELGSVFIDDYCQTENCILIGSRFNINYFLLNYVTSLTKFEFDSTDAFTAKFVEFLTGGGKDWLSKNPASCLNKLKITAAGLGKLFDVTERGSKGVEVRLNTTKAVEWLKSKVELLRENLEKTAVENASRAHVKVKQAVEEDVTSKYRLEAFELIAQYIGKDLAESLRKEVKLASPLAESSSDNKRQKQAVAASE